MRPMFLFFIAITAFHSLSFCSDTSSSSLMTTTTNKVMHFIPGKETLIVFLAGATSATFGTYLWTNNRATKRIATLTQQHQDEQDEATTKITSLEQQLSSATNNLKLSQNENNQAKATMDDLQQRFNELQKTIQEKNQELTSANSSFTKMQEQHAVTHAELTDVQKNLQQKSADLEATKLSLTKAKEERDARPTIENHENIRSMLAKIQQESIQLQNTIQEKNQELTSANKSLTKMRTDFSENESIIVDKLTKTLESLEKKHLEHEKTLSMLTKLQEESIQLQKTIQEKNQELASTNSSLTRMQEQHAATQEQLSAELAKAKEECDARPTLENLEKMKATLAALQKEFYELKENSNQPDAPAAVSSDDPLNSISSLFSSK